MESLEIPVCVSKCQVMNFIAIDNNLQVGAKLLKGRFLSLRSLSDWTTGGNKGTRDRMHSG